MPEPEGDGGRRRGSSVSRARSCGRRKRRKNKVRSTPFPTRLHHHNQSRSGEHGARSHSPGGAEPQPARAAQYRQFRREVFRTRAKADKKMVKSEKINASHSPAAHRCDQRSLHKQQNKCKVHSIKNSSPKKTERLHIDSELTSKCVQKVEKKPLMSSENVPYIKIKKEGCTRDETEKEINYAGAKFSDPPSPSVLPKPPSHWMGINGQHFDQCKELMTYHLKALLKVQL